MTKKRLSQEERRNQIIEVAIALFAGKGFKGATTRAIAKAAGVSEAIIFRHFETKEDLYDAIITYTLEKRRHLWEQEKSPATSQDLESMLRKFAHSYIQRNRQDPTFIRLMMYSALEDHKFRQRFFEINRSPLMRAIRMSLEEGIQAGNFRPVDPHLTIRTFFWSMLQYCISRFVATTHPVDEDSDAEMVNNLVGIFMHGLMEPEGQPLEKGVHP
jgi:AcrR family transcriptional regulator